MKLKDLYEETDDELRERSGINGRAIKWFQEYLRDETYSDIIAPTSTVYDPSTKELTWSMGVNCGLAGMDNIPYKCTKAKGIGISSKTLKKLENLPEEIDGDFTISGLCGQLKSLEGMPRRIHGDFNLRAPNIDTLKDIHKHCDEINGQVTLREQMTGNYLGLLYIKGITKVRCYSHEDHMPYMKALVILNKYLGQGLKGVVAAQREMIDQDLDDFAEE